MVGRVSKAWRLLAALILPLLILAWMPAPDVLFRCQVDGTLRTHCCCASKGASKTPAIRAECCDLEHRASAPDTQQAERAKERPRSMPAAIARTVVGPDVGFTTVGLAVFTRARTPLAPPILLLKHSLLI